MPRKSSSKSLLQRLVDSPAGKLPQIVNAALGIFVVAAGFMAHRQPTSTTTEVPSSIVIAPGPAVRAENPVSPPFEAKNKNANSTLIQSSHGGQSPSVNHVKQDVLIQFDSMERGIHKESPTTKLETAASSGPRSITQVSYGAQSPNVSDVEGNVEIRYGAPLPGNSEKRTGKGQ